MKAKTGGFIIGGDHALNDSVNIGAFAGYARSDVKVKDRASSGDANTFTLGLYGGGAWGAFGLSGGAAYSWHDVSTERSVVFTGFTDAVSADYDARTVQLFGEATYRIDAGAMTFEPYLDLSHVRLKRDAFAEAGGAAALTAAEKAAFATFSTVGLRGLTEVEIGGGAKIRLTGGAGWRHAYGSPMPKARLAFAGGNDFLVHSAPIADDAFVLDLGGETALSGSASLGFGYSGQYGSGFEGHAFKANLNIAF